MRLASKAKTTDWSCYEILRGNMCVFSSKYLKDGIKIT